MQASIVNKLEKYTNIYGKRNISRFKSFLYVLFIPYFFFLEYLCRYRIWKVVLNELMNDEIFDFIDKNEFEYKNKRFRKSDLIENMNDFYKRANLEEVRIAIRGDYIKAFCDVFEKNSSIDVENYTSILVTTDIKVVYVKDTDEFFRSPIYTIVLQYFREFHYIRARKIFFWWLSTVLLMTIILIVLYFKFMSV